MLLVAIFVINPIIFGDSSTGTSYYLPIITQKLIGREADMDTVMNYLNEVKLVTLYGSPGFGKSELALHIGHELLKKGTDVIYLKVVSYESIDDLIDRIITKEKPDGKIWAESKSDEKILKWAKSINKLTLMILDNVDGKVWDRKEWKIKFTNDFVDVLLSHSEFLSILITSQHEIQSTYHNYRTHCLLELSSEKCADLLTLSKRNPELDVTSSESQTVCELAGNVPLVIKILARSLSPSFTAKVLINRINEESNRLYYFERKKIMILTRLKVAYEVIEREYQVCGYLLVGHPRSFSLDNAKEIINSYIMRSIADDFRTEDCVTELMARSFIQPRTSNNATLYDFHKLVELFLTEARKNETMDKVLEQFWKCYIFNCSKKYRSPYLHHLEDDIKYLATVLREHNEYSYILAPLVFYWIRNSDFPRVKDSESASIKEELTEVSRTAIKASCGHINFQEFDKNLRFMWRKLYLYLFEVCDDKNDWPYWYKHKKGNSLFYVLFIDRYSSEADIIQMHYDNRRLNKLMWLGKTLTKLNYDYYNGKLNDSIILGLEYFSYNKQAHNSTMAIRHLRRALNDTSNSSCKGVHDLIIYIALYHIYTMREHDEQGAKSSLVGIIEMMNFQQIDMGCYTVIRDDIIIPFLRSVNEIKLIKQITEKDCTKPVNTRICNIMKDTYLIASSSYYRDGENRGGGGGSEVGRGRTPQLLD